MKILVTCNEKIEFIQEIHCDSLAYNRKSGSFEIPAGGFIITSHTLFKAYSVECENLIMNIVFDQLAEVVNFYEWFHESQSEAWASFNRMLD